MILAMTAASPTLARPGGARLAEWLRDATPALLFGLRLWGSVCLSFYVAFQLELSEPSWAATTAALVCQPVLGASLRKSMFRMVGTVVGAIAIVILAALCRQDRVSFLVGLTLWCAASAFVATILRNFAAYAAALAGYTAAIIAIDVLGPVGKHERDRFPVRHQPRDRNLHRHRLRGGRARADRSRALAAKAGDEIRGSVRRDHGRVYQSVCGCKLAASTSFARFDANCCGE